MFTINFRKFAEKTPGFLSIVVSLAVFMALYFFKSRINAKKYVFEPDPEDNCIVIFTQESCHHCQELKKFCENIDMSKYNIGFYDIADKKNFNLFLKHIRLHRAPISQIGTPAIFSNIGYMIGFDRNNGDDVKFQEFLDNSEFNRCVEKRKNDTTPKELSLKFVSSIVIKEIFSFNNFYTFIFLYIILMLAGFSKNLIIIFSYFGLLMIADFMFLSKHIDVLLFDGTISILALAIGYFCLLFATNRLLKANYGRNQRVARIKDPIPLPILFIISLLTILSSSVKFLKLSDNWQKYGIVLNRQNSKIFLYYFYIIFSVFFYSTLNISIVLAVYKVFLRYKNNYINYLTIVEDLLLLTVGIFIILI
ncbi:MAG: hypothetical protein LBP39_02465 [Rickettsiales bacterium]|jgi:hypothetical protein|nr:hypothetical protein [Rickettsiales bacterium]